MTYLDASPKMLEVARGRLMREGLLTRQVTFVAGDLPQSLAGGIRSHRHSFLPRLPDSGSTGSSGGKAGGEPPGGRGLALSDFQIPAAGWKRWRAGAIHWLMYRFFRVVTRLPAAKYRARSSTDEKRADLRGPGRVRLGIALRRTLAKGLEATGPEALRRRLSGVCCGGPPFRPRVACEIRPICPLLRGENGGDLGVNGIGAVSSISRHPLVLIQRLVVAKSLAWRSLCWAKIALIFSVWSGGQGDRSACVPDVPGLAGENPDGCRRHHGPGPPAGRRGHLLSFLGCSRRGRRSGGRWRGVGVGAGGAEGWFARHRRRKSPGRTSGTGAFSHRGKPRRRQSCHSFRLQRRSSVRYSI